MPAYIRRFCVVLFILVLCGAERVNAADAPLSRQNASSQQAAIPFKDIHFKQNDDISVKGVASTYAVLMLLLGGGIAVLFVIRRRLYRQGAMPIGKQQRLQYRDRRRLNAKTYVYVIAVGEHEYLIADNGQGIAIQPLGGTDNSKINNNTKIEDIT